MAEHNETGKQGEQLAVNWLKDNGFDILETNWRFKNLEADIIAQKQDCLVIVEVKTRHSTYFGEPETFVDKKKQKNLMKTAHEYIEKHKLDVEVRFDIISVVISKHKHQINHIEDAFLFSH